MALALLPLVVSFRSSALLPPPFRSLHRSPHGPSCALSFSPMLLLDPEAFKDKRMANMDRGGREALREKRDFERVFFTLTLVPPLVSMLLFPEILKGTEELLMFFRIAAPVDGNRLSVDLLLPTVNGVVVPVLSIALGTLFATTVNVLRQRQVDIRSYLNTEVCEIRLLRRALFGVFGTYQHNANRLGAFTLLHSYTKRLVDENRPGAITLLQELYKGPGIGENELDQLSAMLHGRSGLE